MPVLLDSAFNTGDNQYTSGPTHPRAKIVELVWNANSPTEDGYTGHIDLFVEVGDDDGYGNWTKGENSSPYSFRISGLDYYEIVTTLVIEPESSVYENVKLLSYEWLGNNSRFSGTLE